MLNVDMSYKYCSTEHFNSKVVQYQLKVVQEKFQAFVYLSESPPVVSFCMNRHRGCYFFYAIWSKLHLPASCRFFKEHRRPSRQLSY